MCFPRGPTFLTGEREQNITQKDELSAPKKKGRANTAFNDGAKQTLAARNRIAAVGDPHAHAIERHASGLSANGDSP